MSSGKSITKLFDTSTTHTKCTKRATIKQQKICSYDAVMKKSMLYKVWKASQEWTGQQRLSWCETRLLASN